MSFAQRVEKLMFTVGLTDKTAGPVGRINARIDKLAQNAEKGFRNIGYGVAGITGAVFALNQAMAPAIEQQRALNEVASLDVEPKALQKLNRMALITQAQYGTAANDIVRSAYDIQSAISGLTGDELSRFTRNSTILAKGTKSDAGVITDYMGTMYGIFSETANRMGKSVWVDQLTGQTANAVKMFKTTGTKMSAAFTTLGAEGQAALRPMHEQMAVLGQLQASMGGSEAGTKYKAFLENVGRAQEALGLQFSDSHGRMLPIVDIMTKIQGKFGQIDTLAKADIIKNAFGSGEAVALVKLLVKDTATLASNIDQLGNVKGMEQAVKMADRMTDPWQKIAGTAKSIHTAFSQALMPVLQPTIDKMVEAGTTVLRWTEMFPHLTRAVSMAGLGIIGLIGTIAALTVAVGIYRFAAVGLGVVHMVLFGQFGLLRPVIAGVAAGYKAAKVALIAYQMASTVGAVKTGFLTKALIVSRSAVWGFNAALLANPVTLIVLGVVALGAAVYGIIKYWDQLSAAVSDFLDKSLAFQMLRVGLDILTIPIRMVWMGVKAIAGAVSELVSYLWQAGQSSGVFDKMGQGIYVAMTPLRLLGQLVGWLLGKVEELAGWFKTIADNGVLNSVAGLFGVEISDASIKGKSAGTVPTPAEQQVTTPVPYLNQPQAAQMQPVQYVFSQPAANQAPMATPDEQYSVMANVNRQVAANQPTPTPMATPDEQYSVMANVNRQVAANQPTLAPMATPDEQYNVMANVNRQVAANQPTLAPMATPDEQYNVMANVNRQVAANQPTLAPMAMSDEQYSVMAKVNRQIAANQPLMADSNVVQLPVKHRVEQTQQQVSPQQVASQPLNLPQGGLFQQMRQEQGERAEGLRIDSLTMQVAKMDDPESFKESLLLAAM